MVLLVFWLGFFWVVICLPDGLLPLPIVPHIVPLIGYPVKGSSSCSLAWHRWC
jgi:hypothetical protein